MYFFLSPSYLDDDSDTIISGDVVGNDDKGSNSDGHSDGSGSDNGDFDDYFYLCQCLMTVIMVIAMIILGIVIVMIFSTVQPHYVGLSRKTGNWSKLTNARVN